MVYVVGLTGGIGSGKTQASDYFASLGIHIVDADIAARIVVQLGKPALSHIKEAFGAEALLPSGELNRPWLREKIFALPQARHQLEAITHPLIRDEIKAQLAQAKSTYAILVSPLLFETSQIQLTHRSLVIDATEALQKQRAAKRDGVSETQITHIMATQLSREARRAKANDIVENHGDLIELQQQLYDKHQLYCELAHDWQRSSNISIG